jgi:hypothetical protein
MLQFGVTKVLGSFWDDLIYKTDLEGIPKCLCRKGGTPSRTLPHMAIANRKPFHSLCPGYRSEERNFGGACSDKGVQNIHRSFWDEFLL